jgi:hypothetical protein
MRPIKKDSYFRSRGSVYRKWRIVCANCQTVAFDYQKDGRGPLKRAYLNRILAPESLAALQDQPLAANDLHALKCESCGSVLGIPMLHWEGRLAFRLVPGQWGKKVMSDSAKKGIR